ncbi:hypothetical protein [Sutcliffiella halmapala]|uniref:hypothetical protein n=1 Tax=Sutcliffiella halmapala TaxID=79882 RepID=UPI000994B1EB|nr:hypothetical protein [Sutcliffiella halmapala]
MKKLVALSMTALLAAMMSACSDETNNATENKDPVEQNEKKEDGPSGSTNQTDPDWITPVGETISTEGGDFTFHARNDKVEAVETGSLTVDFDQVATISGALSPEFAEYVGVDELEYIQLDIQVVNNSQESITFDAYQATVITNTGEEITMPNPKLGPPPEGNFEGEEKKQASIFYVLESSKAEEVEWVRIIMEAPRDKNDEKVGEDLDIKVELKG